MEYEREGFDLGELLEDVESTLSFRASSKGVSLQMNRPQVTLPHYKSDSLRIKQVLLNIIGNAIKFSEKGRVRVDLDVQQIGVSDYVRFLIADDGIGMSLEQLAKIFRPFSQADSSTGRQYGGSGLGLVISRQIARGLGGDVRLIRSKPGEGSEFEVTFKLERLGKSNLSEVDRGLEDEIDESPDLSHLSGKKILAVDDSDDNLLLIQMFLRQTGIELHTAENGARALESVANIDFDLILMDIQMPEMDGHETTRQIRSSGEGMPIIALTAHATRTEYDRCLASGCNAVLTKPVKDQTLIRLISHYLKLIRRDSASPKSYEPRPRL